MVTGIMDVIVEEIPAVVYCKDINWKDTPKKGPNIDPKAINVMAFLSRTAFYKSSHLFVQANRIRKPIKPVIILICVAAKGL